MAIGIPVNIGTAQGTTATVVITTSATANVGDLILVATVMNGMGASAVIDSAGNTYTQDKTGTNSVILRVWRTIVTTQLVSGGTITITGSLGFQLTTTASLTTGITSPPLDVAGTAATGTSATPSGSVTTLNAVDLIIGVVGYGSSATLTPVGAPWTELTGNEVSSANVHWAYQIVAATSTYTYNPVISSGVNWVDYVLSYKATASGGTPQLMLLGVGI